MNTIEMKIPFFKTKLKQFIFKDQYKPRFFASLFLSILLTKFILVQWIVYKVNKNFEYVFIPFIFLSVILFLVGKKNWMSFYIGGILGILFNSLLSQKIYLFIHNYYDISEYLFWTYSVILGVFCLLLSLFFEKQQEIKKIHIENELYLTESQRIAQIGSWNFNVQQNKCTWTLQTYQIFGVSPQSFELTYDSFMERIIPEDRPIMNNWIEQSILQQHPPGIEFRVILPNNQIRTLFGRGDLYLNSNNSPNIIIGTVQDITDQKRTENDLRNSKEMAESAARIKSDFLANMSHELRTPMCAILGLSELALNEELTANARDYFEKIKSSSDSLLCILNEILNYSRLEAGVMELENKHFHLDLLLEQINNLFYLRAREKNIKLNFDIESNIYKNLLGDALRIQQILCNLLGNAIKFTEFGSVTLKVRSASSSANKIKLVFSISDTGIGIAKERIPYIFKPFIQADSSISRKFGGSGLGLSISQSLLKLMNSELHVESKINLGTTFIFSIELEKMLNFHELKNFKLQNQIQLGSLTKELTYQSNHIKGANILLTEDNLINQLIIKKYLELSGLKVDVANNGKEALQLLSNKIYDAILMDIQMPEMDGLQASREIRTHFNSRYLPIIALSAGVTNAEKEQCLEAGMNEFVAKPINPMELINTLNLLLNGETQTI